MQLVIELPIRPVSINAVFSQHFQTRRRVAKRTRALACEGAIDVMSDLGLTTRPLFSWIGIDVRPWAIDRRFDQDPANCVPTQKACLDGFVDARVIFDDTRRFVRWVTFYPHQFGKDAIEFTLTGELFDSSREILPARTLQLPIGETS